MILMIDNFDSFTYNLVQALESAGQEVEVRRNDAVNVSSIEQMDVSGIVISPGPGTPLSAGISIDTIKQFHDKLPILGVCLGHQCIAQAFGGRIIHAARVMHGKFSQISHDDAGIFASIPQQFSAVRYHSLSVDRTVLPEELLICATADDGEVMGLRHKTLPVYGVQFHPESIATQYGCEMIHAFIAKTKEVI